MRCAIGRKTLCSSDGSISYDPDSPFGAEIFPLFMARLMVALFLPVAAAASERVYFMVLRVRCASLHCYAVRRVAPLQGFSYRRRFSCFLQYATKAAPAFLGGFPLAASALAKAIQSDRRTW